MATIMQAEPAEAGKAVTLFPHRTLIPQAGGQTAHQEKKVITAIMQMMLNLICGMMVGQAEAAVQQVEVVEAMAEDADI